MRELKTDEELLERLRAGDENAIRDVAEAYGSKIYQLAFRYLRNKEDAEEVTQDVLYKVHRKIDAFRGDAALSSWIYRITFNAAMSRLRTAKYQRYQNEDFPFRLQDIDGRLPYRQACEKAARAKKLAVEPLRPGQHLAGLRPHPIAGKIRVHLLTCRSAQRTGSTGRAAPRLTRSKSLPPDVCSVQ